MIEKLYFRIETNLFYEYFMKYSYDTFISQCFEMILLLPYKIRILYNLARLHLCLSSRNGIKH